MQSKVEKWKIGQYNLEYHDDTHTYLIDGNKVLSITQLLHFFFPKKYDGIDEEMLKNAAKKGTLVHDAIEMYCKFGVPSDDIPELNGFLTLQHLFKFKVKSNEIPIIFEYKGYYFAGRLDLVLEFDNGDIEISDIKRTAVFDKEYVAMQTNLYRLGYHQSYGELPKSVSGIHLRNDNRHYYKLPVNEEYIYKKLDEYIEAQEQAKVDETLEMLDDLCEVLEDE